MSYDKKSALEPLHYDLETFIDICARGSLRKAERKTKNISGHERREKQKTLERSLQYKNRRS